MRDGVNCRINFRIDITDKVELTEETRRLRRYDGCVLDDPFYSPVQVSYREHKTARQLLLKTDNVFVREAELGARQDRVYRVLRCDTDTAAGAASRSIQ